GAGRSGGGVGGCDGGGQRAAQPDRAVSPVRAAGRDRGARAGPGGRGAGAAFCTAAAAAGGGRVIPPEPPGRKGLFRLIGANRNDITKAGFFRAVSPILVQGWAPWSYARRSHSAFAG